MGATTPPGSDTGGGAIKNTRLMNDGTTDRILEGYDKDGFGVGNDFGFKISQRGYDVATATDAQLIMSSAFNMFKIIATGTITTPVVSAAGGSATVVNTSVNLGNISNGLPLAHVAFVADSSNYYPLPYYRLQFYGSPTLPFGGFTPYNIWTSYTSVNGSSELLMNVNSWNADTTGSQPSRTIKYFIFAETAS